MTTEDSRREVTAHVTAVVTRLQGGYLASSGREQPTNVSAASLAKLRRGDVADPAAEPAVWEITIPGMPDRLLNDGGLPSRAEEAMHAALVLYAYHQQGRRKPMHVAGRSLGAAVRELSRSRGTGDETDKGTLRRFHAVATSGSASVRLHHLRGLVALLRGEEIAMDYGRLAGDLYLLAQNDSRTSRVRYAWGRDLHRAPPTDLETDAAVDAGNDSATNIKENV